LKTEHRTCRTCRDAPIPTEDDSLQPNCTLPNWSRRRCALRYPAFCSRTPPEAQSEGHIAAFDCRGAMYVMHHDIDMMLSPSNFCATSFGQHCTS